MDPQQRKALTDALAKLSAEMRADLLAEGAAHTRALELHREERRRSSARLITRPGSAVGASGGFARAARRASSSRANCATIAHWPAAAARSRAVAKATSTMSTAGAGGPPTGAPAGPAGVGAVEAGGSSTVRGGGGSATGRCNSSGARFDSRRATEDSGSPARAARRTWSSAIHLEKA